MVMRTKTIGSAKPWLLTTRADPCGAALADRHYSRQTPGAKQFVPPGRCVVLLTRAADALWVSSWPYPEYTKHAWPGAWVCTLFRNESPQLLSSLLIREAIGITRWTWGKPPGQGMITFVDPKRVRPKRDPGFCFLAAGFEYAGQTKTGKIALRIQAGRMPHPSRPIEFAFANPGRCCHRHLTSTRRHCGRKNLTRLKAQAG
jgi:hypothetical protein